MSAREVIRIRGLGVRFGEQTVLRDCNLTLLEGESLALIGPSGAGKTTLIRVLLGLQNATSGTVSLFGMSPRNTKSEQWHHLRNRLGIVFQKGALFSSLTVARNIAFPVQELHHVPTNVQDALVRMKARSVGLREVDLRKRPAQLSGGIVRRVALARSLALDPDLVLFDEPTSGLDPIAARQFIQLIKKLRTKQHFSQLMISHDPEVVLGLSDRVAVMWDGGILAIGSVDQIAGIDHPFVRAYFEGRESL